MGFIGLDILAIRHLARQLDTQAREVDLASRELTNLIANTDWFGIDSRRFTEAWHSTRIPELKRVSELLREASALASRGATKQEDASRS